MSKANLKPWNRERTRIDWSTTLWNDGSRNLMTMRSSQYGWNFSQHYIFWAICHLTTSEQDEIQRPPCAELRSKQLYKDKDPWIRWWIDYLHHLQLKIRSSLEMTSEWSINMIKPISIYKKWDKKENYHKISVLNARSFIAYVSAWNHISLED